MARFNPTQKNTPNPRRTRNYEGEIAYLQPDKYMALYVATATSLLSSKFYEPAPVKRGRKGGWVRDEAAGMKQAVEGIIKLAEPVEANFIANLAVYLRNEMYLRSVSNLLVAHLAVRRELDQKVVPLVARRPDDIKELVAMYRYLKSGPDAREIPTMPAQLKKGGAETLRYQYMMKDWATKSIVKKLRDPYGFRKYNRGGKEDITFLDLMRLFHPTPANAEQAETFRMVKEGTLPTIDTWETVISAAGSDPQDKRAAWEKVIDGGMPYMAALRNLRNIMQAGVSPKHVRKVIDLISDKEAVANSMQLPFRFYSAYRELEGAYGTVTQATNFKGVLDAVEQAMYHSCGNIPGFDWLRDLRVLAAADISGSMSSPVSGHSKVTCIDIATVLTAAFAANTESSIVGAFGSQWVPVAPTSRILKTVDDLVNSGAGWSTNGHLVVDWAIQNNTFLDMFVYFTDMQLWSQGGFTMDRSAFEQSFNQYKARVNPKARLVIFNLNGYQTTPIDVVRNDVLEIAGWSDKIFQVLSTLEQGGDFLEKFKKPLILA